MLTVFARPEDYEFVPGQNLLSGQTIKHTFLLPDSLHWFCTASYLDKTTWIWAPYDHSQGSKDEDHEFLSDRDQEYRFLDRKVEEALRFRGEDWILVDRMDVDGE